MAVPLVRHAIMSHLMPNSSFHFQRLKAVSYDLSEEESQAGREEKNVKKNRFPSILPREYLHGLAPLLSRGSLSQGKVRFEFGFKFKLGWNRSNI